MDLHSLLPLNNTQSERHNCVLMPLIILMLIKNNNICNILLIFYLIVSIVIYQPYKKEVMKCIQLNESLDPHNLLKRGNGS
jgi:Gpi18-like mannosyltransferase